MKTFAFPLTGPINLQARLGRGAVTVDAVPGLTEATVELSPRHPGSDVAERVLVELHGNTLTITAPRENNVRDMLFSSNRGRQALDTAIRVPAGTAMRISTISADVTVRGEPSGVDIAAGSAQITVEHVGGDLRLRVGSGHCRVERVAGSVSSRAGSGRSSFGWIDGGLDAVCGSGELVVGQVHGAVRSRSGSGSASLAAVHGDVDLASGSGPMSIGLPAGRSARLDVTTGSGTVTSDLPIESVPTAKGRPITVRARTGSGDIRLFRAAAESAA
jgi:hypothetical protein